MPVTGTMRMFMPILMKTWLNRSVTTPTATSFPQAIARLVGDSQTGEENHRIQRQHHDGADESFLLGNDGENEIIWSFFLRQKSQRDLVTLAPAFAQQSAGADGNQRLPSLIRTFKLRKACRVFLFLRRVFIRETCAEINQQPLPLIILNRNLEFVRCK